MSRQRIAFLFLNLGHFLDHLFMLIFASAAALLLADAWQMRYAELIPYATPGFVAFGTGALAAGWLADRWSREGMMVIFFLGTGASAISAAFADGPAEIAVSLTLVGLFASIYHPVGLSLVVAGRARTGMALAVNGVYGNLGVACAALLTGFFIDVSGWRSAFVVPGAVSIVLGLLYWQLVRTAPPAGDSPAPAGGPAPADPGGRTRIVRIFAIVFFTTALGGLVFQSTTFSLPRVLEEELAVSATRVGVFAFVVFAVAAVAQLVVGHLVDRHSIRAVFALVALLQGIFLAAMTQVSGLASVAVAVAFMLVVFGQIPINDVLVGRVARSEWRSRAYALRYIVTFSVMASAVPLIAWVHAHFGFDRLFALLSVTAFVIFLAVLLLPATRPAQAA